MSNFENMCASLYVPLEESKTIGPTLKLVFLGLELNSILFQIQVLQDELQQLKSNLMYLLQKKKVTLKELQSIVGHLSF